MRIPGKIKPSVELIAYLEDSPRIIASAGKQTISPKEFTEIYRGMDPGKTEKWIRELVKRGHGSPLEHSIYIFNITCSRVASHQLVRHRIASYTQLSQRYSDKYLRSMVDHAAKLIGRSVRTKHPGRRDYEDYAVTLKRFLESNPSVEELLDTIGEAFIVPPAFTGEDRKEYLRSLIAQTAAYYEALSNGIGYEDARFLLPQAVKTKIVASMNARELLENFLPLRMCSHAQWEIRFIAWRMWRMLYSKHPVLFRYAGPRCILLENRARMEPCSLREYLNGKCGFTVEKCPELVPRGGILNCLRHASRDPWTGEDLSHDTE